MVLAAGLFVANDSCMKAVMAEAPPLQVLFMRGVAACLWCLPLLLVLGHRRSLKHMCNRWILVRCLGEILAVTCYVLALKHMQLADITAIFQIAPFFLLIGAWLIWGETIGGVRLALIAVGILGALLVAQPGTSTATPYALLGFATAIGAAARDLASRKVPAPIPGLVVSFSMLVSVMLAAAAATVTFENWVPPRTWHLVLMGFAGLLLMGGHFFIFVAFRLARARALAPFYYSFTIWAVLLGFVIFGELPNLLAIGGILLIVSAGLAVLLLSEGGGLPAGHRRRPATTE